VPSLARPGLARPGLAPGMRRSRRHTEKLSGSFLQAQRCAGLREGAV